MSSPEDKMGMSLDDISSQNKSSAGKARNTQAKRAGRRAKASPYGDSPRRSSCEDTDTDENTQRRVYVGNLSWNVTWRDLKDHMQQAGRVSHADVMTEPGGRSKGYGIVTFASADEAQCAIDTLTDSELDGRNIFVREDREESHRSYTPGNSKRVYIGNIAWGVKWQDLKDHMRRAGNVIHADVLESNGRSKGCGLVEYSTAEEAEKAIEVLNDTLLSGRRIFVREDREPEMGSISSIVRRSSGQRQRAVHTHSSGGGGGRALYVGNLSWETSWQDLKDHFGTIGTVDRADVAQKDGRSRGYGIVKYENASDARDAIDEFNGSMFNGRKIEVREDRGTA